MIYQNCIHIYLNSNIMIWEWIIFNLKKIYVNKKVDDTNILISDYNKGCFEIIDASLSIESCTFRDNQVEFIFSMSRLIDTIH